MTLMIQNCQKLFKHALRYPTRIFFSSITEPGLFTEVSPSVEDTDNKVTIVGAGQIGVACAFTILTQGISDSVVLVDKNENKLLGETLDLKQGSLFLKTRVIEASTSYKKTANSKVTIVTPGIRRKYLEEALLIGAQKNTEVFREVIPEIVKYSPNTILIIVTNPVDIMTWVAWKMSRLPLNRVIGSGTNIDTSRLRVMMATRYGIPANTCHVHVIGEHGKNLIPVWSSADVEGVRLRELNPKAAKEDDQDNWKRIEQILVRSSETIMKLKGQPCWAIALSVAQITDNILSNENKIRTVSTNVKGYHGVNWEVFLSLPCVLNANGLHKIVKQHLEKEEREKFYKTAEEHRKCMDKIELH